jgi:PqqD family protein of HPr-rel-A system
VTQADHGIAHDGLWRAAPAHRLDIRKIDALTLVFDRASGQTHLLAPPLPEILNELAGGNATSAQVAARLAEGFDLSAQGDVPALVAERLAELAALGLVSQS